jgi:hypothetical protein
MGPFWPVFPVTNHKDTRVALPVTALLEKPRYLPVIGGGRGGAVGSPANKRAYTQPRWRATRQSALRFACAG